MKNLLCYLMALLYLLAGINHFIHPDIYVGIMPSWLPFPRQLVAISGVVEIALALLLLPPATRRFAAWGVIFLLIAVFPANVQMAINWHRESHPKFWISVVRLPLQAVLIWWAWQYTRRQQSMLKQS